MYFSKYKKITQRASDQFSVICGFCLGPGMQKLIGYMPARSLTHNVNNKSKSFKSLIKNYAQDKLKQEWPMQEVPAISRNMTKCYPISLSFCNLSLTGICLLKSLFNCTRRELSSILPANYYSPQAFIKTWKAQLDLRTCFSLNLAKSSRDHAPATQPTSFRDKLNGSLLSRTSVYGPFYLPLLLKKIHSGWKSGTKCFAKSQL